MCFRPFPGTESQWRWEMPNGMTPVLKPVNEAILAYAPGSTEKARLKTRIGEMLAEEIEIPLIIGGKEIRTGNL